jgi:hypothetical protein
MFVVYTMGRVGTVSVRDALVRTAPYVQIEVSHYITPHGIQDREAFRGRRDDRAHRVQAQLAAGAGGVPYFISLVRDPVARDVSIVMKRAEVGRYQPSNGHALTVLDLQNEFVKHGPGNALGWMDNELGSFLDIDIYATPFDRNLGYQIYELNRGRLLIIRLDQLSRKFPIAMQEFVGFPFCTPVRLNSSCEGPAAEVCDAFRKNLKLDNVLLDTYYSSKFSRHFFSDEELTAFRSKWGRT